MTFSVSPGRPGNDTMAMTSRRNEQGILKLEKSPHNGSIVLLGGGGGQGDFTCLDNFRSSIRGAALSCSSGKEGRELLTRVYNYSSMGGKSRLLRPYTLVDVSVEANSFGGQLEQSGP